MHNFKNLLFVSLLFFGFVTVLSKKSDDKNKPEWAKKDIRDYNDADLERLLDQWEVSFMFFFSNHNLSFAENLVFPPRKMKNLLNPMSYRNI